MCDGPSSLWHHLGSGSGHGNGCFAGGTPGNSLCDLGTPGHLGKDEA
jgi:hypothetical protein